MGRRQWRLEYCLHYWKQLHWKMWFSISLHLCLGLHSSRMQPWEFECRKYIWNVIPETLRGQWREETGGPSIKGALSSQLPLSSWDSVPLGTSGTYLSFAIQGAMKLGLWSPAPPIIESFSLALMVKHFCLPCVSSALLWEDSPKQTKSSQQWSPGRECCVIWVGPNSGCFHFPGHSWSITGRSRATS